MSKILGRLAGKTSQNAFRQRVRAAFTETEAKAEGANNEFKREAKKDPELYILFAIMSGAFCLVGYHFGTNLTASTSEDRTYMAQDTMPWQTEATGDFKYQYHPGGDRSKPLKNAPSALFATILPPMTLPKEAHEKFNRYGKDDWN